MSEPIYKDLFGRDIQVGDYIVYAAVDGRSGTLRTGRVLKLTQSKEANWRDNTFEPKLFVASWSNFRGSWGPDGRSGRQKNVTLGFLDRLIVVPAEQVSDKIKRDLEGPICGWDGLPITKD